MGHGGFSFHFLETLIDALLNGRSMGQQGSHGEQGTVVEAIGPDVIAGGVVQFGAEVVDIAQGVNHQPIEVRRIDGQRGWLGH
jgi:hypothetical protein